jgi:hypothetical protein
MKIKKIVLIIALFLGIGAFAQAQDYTSAIGLRLGYPTSVSYKHFISTNNALEGFAGFRTFSNYNWFNIGGLYQVHNEIPDVDGLLWYFGGGASVFFWSYDDDFIDPEGSTSIGVLGNLGLDYKFADAPINVSLDWAPVFFVNGFGSGFSGGYGALSVRYVLR